MVPAHVNSEKFVKRGEGGFVQVCRRCFHIASY
jgi:hypothetical protein